MPLGGDGDPAPELTWRYCLGECPWLAIDIGPHRHLLRDDGTMGIVVERLPRQLAADFRAVWPEAAWFGPESDTP